MKKFNGWMIRYKFGFSFNSLSHTRAVAWKKELSDSTLTKKEIVKRFGARAVKVKIIEVK